MAIPWNRAGHNIFALWFLSFFFYLSLWPPYVIGQSIIFLQCGFYLSCFFFLLLSFFSTPSISGRGLEVCHTSTHGVALVRI